MAEYKLYNQDNMTALEQLGDNSLDAIVTDAPYGLGKEPNAKELIKAWLDKGYLEIKGKGFMGKEWDAFVPQPAFWKLAYRKLKPGGYVLCFFGTRTYDWGVLAMRLAGFEIRDCIQWIYGSGFPKSLDVSKAIDKKNGRYFDDGFKDYCNERRIAKGLTLNQINELLGVATNGGGLASSYMGDKEDNQLPTLEMYRKLKIILDMDDRYGSLIEMVEADREVIGYNEGSLLAIAPGKQNDRSQTSIEVTAPATDQAKTWDGYGTALKPAYEPICVARKPLDGSVAENVLKHGCGAINLDGCRIGWPNGVVPEIGTSSWGGRNKQLSVSPQQTGESVERTEANKLGRFPANIILDEDAAAIMDSQSGELTSGNMAAGTYRHNQNGFTGPMPPITGNATYGDSGGASRFFYCAKASRSDRDYGCEGMEYKEGGPKSNTSGQHITRRDGFVPSPIRNNHPTVKPIALMRYLVRLVKTPFETCTIADLFTGSGTTGVACMLEGINFYGCEMETSSYDIAVTRIEYAKQEYLKEQAKPKQGDLFA